MFGETAPQAATPQDPVPPLPIVAVAGHIDHGKTALVRALSGIETDRLPEEKRRGISIETGIAHWSGRPGSPLPALSFVDVPGHERFMRNMIAGIQGARIALLVVACDDGIMPQTREHAAILKMLGVTRWTVALTKADLLAPSDLATRREAVARWLEEEAIPARIMAVSAQQGRGLSELASDLARLVHGLADDDAPVARRPLAPSGRAARLCIDRTFVARGEGLIVTGLLSSGMLNRGDTVTLAPDGRLARIRGLQVAGQAVAQVQAGARCAINLAGSGIDAESVVRGNWLIEASLAHPVNRIDAWLHALDTASLGRHRDTLEVQVHAGTARVMARVTIRAGQAAPAGEPRRLARLHTDAPVIATLGDRWIVRSADGAHTLGVAEVAWPFIDPLGLRGPAHADLLARLASCAPAEWLATALGELPAGMPAAHFQAAWALRDEALPPILQRADAIPCGRGASLMLIDRRRLVRVQDQLLQATERWHAEHPESVGLDWRDALAQVSRADRRFYAGEALARLQSEGALHRNGDSIFRPGHIPAPSADDERFRLRVLPLLSERRSRSVHELSELLELPVDTVRVQLARLALQGLAVAVTPQRFIAVTQMRSLADCALDAARAGSLHAAEFSRRTGIGRNLSIDVLEFFDRIRFTRRVGNRRIVINAHALSAALNVTHLSEPT